MVRGSFCSGESAIGTGETENAGGEGGCGAGRGSSLESGLATQFRVRQDKPPASTLDSAPCSVASVFCLDSLAVRGEALSKSSQGQLSYGQLRSNRQAPSTPHFWSPFFTLQHLGVFGAAGWSSKRLGGADQTSTFPVLTPP